MLNEHITNNLIKEFTDHNTKRQSNKVSVSVQTDPLDSVLSDWNTGDIGVIEPELIFLRQTLKTVISDLTNNVKNCCSCASRMDDEKRYCKSRDVRFENSVNSYRIKSDFEDVNVDLCGKQNPDCENVYQAEDESPMIKEISSNRNTKETPCDIASDSFEQLSGTSETNDNFQNDHGDSNIFVADQNAHYKDDVSYSPPHISSLHVCYSNVSSITDEQILDILEERHELCVELKMCKLDFRIEIIKDRLQLIDEILVEAAEEEELKKSEHNVKLKCEENEMMYIEKCSENMNGDENLEHDNNDDNMEYKENDENLHNNENDENCDNSQNNENFDNSENDEKLDSSENDEKLDNSEMDEKLDSSENDEKLDSSEMDEKLDSSENNEKLDSSEMDEKLDNSENDEKVEIDSSYIEDDKEVKYQEYNRKIDDKEELGFCWQNVDDMRTMNSDISINFKNMINEVWDDSKSGFETVKSGILMGNEILKSGTLTDKEIMKTGILTDYEILNSGILKDTKPDNELSKSELLTNNKTDDCNNSHDSKTVESEGLECGKTNDNVTDTDMEFNSADFDFELCEQCEKYNLALLQRETIENKIQSVSKEKCSLQIQYEFQSEHVSTNSEKERFYDTAESLMTLEKLLVNLRKEKRAVESNVVDLNSQIDDVCTCVSGQNWDF